MGKGCCPILNESKQNYRGSNCRNSRTERPRALLSARARITANYRVRSLLTVSFPTDVSDRNPKSSIFVEPSGDNDERIFVEQIGHAAVPVRASGYPDLAF